MGATGKNPYQYFSVTADVMALRKEPGERLAVLLIRRKHPPHQGAWALPGGFLDREESGLQAARRELREETGLRARKLVEFGSFSDPARDPRGRTVTIAFFTVVSRSARVKAGDDAGEADWFDTRDLPRLAFDHRQIIRQGLKRYRELKKR